MYQSGDYAANVVLVSQIVNLVIIQGLEPTEALYDPIDNPLVGSVHQTIKDTKGKHNER